MVDTRALSTRLVALTIGVLLAVATMLVTAPAVSKKTGEEVGTFNGTLDVERFKKRGDTLYADGWVTGSVERNDGTTSKEVAKRVKLPVQNATTGGAADGGETGTFQAQQQQQGCDVLNLELGPLDLDLLGLVVQLDQVNLDIIAEPGAGNLLGNLLCAVAGLLDPGAPNLLGIVEDILNEVLSILEGL
jgi:hypothetical protein